MTWQSEPPEVIAMREAEEKARAEAIRQYEKRDREAPVLRAGVPKFVLEWLQKLTPEDVERLKGN